MKTLGITLSTLIAIAASAAWFGPLFASTEGAARELVAPTLYDPSSAQFRNLRVSGDFLCGEVNGKNRFGAYVGFRPFAGVPKHGPSSVIIVEEGKSFAEFAQFCVRKS